MDPYLQGPKAAPWFLGAAGFSIGTKGMAPVVGALVLEGP